MNSTQKHMISSMPSTNLDKTCNRYFRYPDESGHRQAEGGLRLEGKYKVSLEDKPLITVVTVVYNNESTLERCIRSVLGQIYDNLEYIIIDGGSTDGTMQIINEYKGAIDYFISEPDNGIYNAMNKGISLAKGEYVCLLNSDDFYSDEFISESVKKAKESNSDIVFSNCSMFGKETIAGKISEGIFIHYLNINHSTFLVSKETYNDIGPYREDYKIISDAIWMRTAYKHHKKFNHLSKCMFHFEEGGLSSGNNESRRNLFIDEAAKGYREIFSFLTLEESKELYLSRFNLKRVYILLKLSERYELEHLFIVALKEYVKFLLSNSFLFEGSNITEYLPYFRELCHRLEIDYSYLRINLPSLNMNKLFSSIDHLTQNVINDKHNEKVVLHYVSKFSSPSETFIYDLIQRMEECGGYINIVLCDERILEDIRPFDKCIQFDWDNALPVVRELMYEHLFSKLSPDIAVGHFAINGWKLYQRLDVINFQVPLLHMTHGIDVFTIGTNEKYRKYILNDANLDPNTKFTTVSKYLRKELTDRGVPAEKITLVHNVIHQRFYQHRKVSGYYDGKRTLQILSVGRLVEWKGHAELLEGLKYFTEHHTSNIHLTIVYGNTDTMLHKLTDKAEELGISQNVSFIEFVDFNKIPDYYSHFDIFVSSSKYTNGIGRRSETFGMSTLEAIAAGLPVVVTDAGGSPEVVGDEKVFAKIVPHGDGEAIGKALIIFVQENKCFQDNIQFASERLEAFSSEKQLSMISKIINELVTPKTKIALFTSMIESGAGKAALRVHKALLMNNTVSMLISRDHKSSKSEVPYCEFLEPEIGLQWEMMQSNQHVLPGNTIFSLNEPNLRRKTLFEIASKVDVINIQWIARFLSAEDIGYLSNLGKPLVITLRDMNPLTGGCHFFHGCDRWQEDCYGCPQLIDDENHYPAKTLAIKKRYWNMQNISFIALSKHSANIIEQSALYGSGRIEVIHNPIDLKAFLPTPKEEARQYFKLKNKTPFLFYVPSYGSRIKGFLELKESLKYVRKQYTDFKMTLLLAGSGAKLIKQSDFDFPVINLGAFKDEKLLARAYSAADVTVIPSLEETFSNTAAESVSCGTPIVGFDTGALPEISGEGLRGETVPVGNVKALGDAIYRTLNRSFSDCNCRSYAEENFSFYKQGEKYREFFNSLKNSSVAPTKVNPDFIPLIDSSISAEVYRWQAKVKKMIIENEMNLKQNQSKSINKINTKQKDIQVIKHYFENLCAISVFMAPMEKYKRYKETISTIHAVKHRVPKHSAELNDLLTSFENLCEVNTKTRPIKKILVYKELIHEWHKIKSKI